MASSCQDPPTPNELLAVTDAAVGSLRSVRFSLTRAGWLVTPLLFLAACGSSTPAAPAVTAPAGSVVCSYVPSSRPAAREVEPPTAVQPATGIAGAAINLTGGTVEVELNQEVAPCTVGSFVHLAQAGYFDDTPCHRLTAAPSLSVLQCGDPSGTGGGGPGYTYADETNPDMVYPAGTLAMANAGPDTNGSQFFLVYADSFLPPDYTVFGSITSGLDVITDIAAQGITGSGNATAPVQPVTITSVTVEG
jgi:peptidyl-prolyl cis-trans isomerase B (cyclophilin B)